MFTGLVQAVAEVVSLDGGRLIVSAPEAWDDPMEIGESIAVNGCCLTLVDLEPDLSFDLSEETLHRTAFATLHPDARVNLERALRADGRLGGHFVQGHVDGVGRLVSRILHEESETFRFAIPAKGSRYLIDKGSIAVDGISLTVIEPRDTAFEVSVIPHTLASTNLASLEPGDSVNLEYDVLAKYVERMLGR